MRQQRRRFLCQLLWMSAGVLLCCGRVWAQPPVVGEISPAKYEVTEELNHSIPMRDGVELKGDIFLPKGEEKFPAIVYLTPYNKSGNGPRAKEFAARGYVVVNADTRGRFESGGEWDPFTPLHKLDGYDLVEWAAHQGWCTGKVGMFGQSYMGWTQWWTATQGPPSLKAIVPEVAPPDQFLNCPYQNGVLVCWMVDWAGNMSGRMPHSAGPGPYGGFAVNREEAYRKLPYIDFEMTRKHLPTVWWKKLMEQNTAEGEYWKEIAYQTPEDYGRVTVPSLAITGWFDANFPGTPSNYLGMKAHGGSEAARRARMVIGPWDHGINTKREAAGVDFGEQALIDWNGYVCRWFDYHLKGIENGVLNDPPIFLFVMGENAWRRAEEWPLPETVFTKYYLHSGGKANTREGDGSLSPVAPGEERADEYTYDPENPTPSAGFQNGHIDGPRDISGSEAREDVLVYTTEVLQEDVDVIGPITAKLFASTSARDTDWMMRLSDVQPDGKALFLAEGLMRAKHRDPGRGGAYDPGKLSEIEPGKAYAYEIEFYRTTANRFAAGHRIRVEISSSYYPYFLRNLNSGEENVALATKSVPARQTIYHDAGRASHVLLPLIPVRGAGGK